MRNSVGLLALNMVAVLSACTMPYKTPVIEAMAPTTGAFPGLRSLAPGRPLKVLVVHGMCTHRQSWIDNWVDAMRRTLQSADVPGSVETVGGIETKRYDFNDRGRRIEMTFVLWSPITTAAKKVLRYDSAPAFPFKRATINATAKTELINDCFADPVIYSGSMVPDTIGSALRSDMAGVVCIFLGGAWRDAACSGADRTTDRAFITESLGSKMLFDAVETIVPAGKSLTPAAMAQRDALRQTRAIYMLANQLPLLRLAAMKPNGARAVATESELRLFGPESPGRTLTAADAPPLQIVAFTDPNDQFSYRLTYASVAEQPSRVALFNVIVSNATTYFGKIENPYPAHTAYWTNPRVPSLVLNGGTATQSYAP